MRIQKEYLHLQSKKLKINQIISKKLKESIENIVNKYIQLSNYKVERTTIDLHLLTHPDYPSIKSISDTYDYFGVENIVANVPFEVLNQLSDIFIGLIDDKLHLININKNSAFIINEKLEKRKISLKKLKEIWNGVIIAIEPKEENKNSQKIKNESLLLGGLLLSSFLPIIITYNINSIAFNICTYIGLLISYFIINESFGMNNKTVAKFFDTISKKEGCSNVINNTNSKLFNIIHLSDASIVYFSSLLLFSVFVEFNVPLLFIVSVLTLPVITYSIYYQAVITKDWCALCIGISVILIIQFLILLYNLNDFTFNLSIILKAIFIMFFIIILWNKIKKLQKANINLEATQIEFFKFKRNKVLFNELLSKRQLVNNDLLLLNDNRIFFGATKPKLVIIAVTNPLCGFCAESFHTYYKILNKYEHVQINFVFSLFTNDTDNPAYKILISFLELYNKNSKKEALDSLNEWFELKNFDDWIKKHEQPTLNNINLDDLLERHRNWATVNDISKTPTTIINNCFYPNEYSIKDVFYFIDDLILDNE